MVEASEDHISMWEIYRQSQNNPDEVVARRWEVSLTKGNKRQPTGDVVSAATLDEVRQMLLMINPCFVRVPRAGMDDPQVIESWL